MIAELVAAGCSGGDWERVEESWDLNMYRSMQRHWLRLGPPTYITAALFNGHRPPLEDTPDLVTDPEVLAAHLSNFPGGRVV